MSLVTSLSHAFLDLAAAIPYPTLLPPYSSTIILTTIGLRCAILPVTLWSRFNVHKGSTVVTPQLPQLRDIAIRDAVNQLRAEGLRGDRDFLNKACNERATRLFKQDQKQLRRKYGVYPRLSFIAPVVVHAPLFILGSWTFAKVALPGSPLELESFLTLPTLVGMDPTMFLPILYGCITFADVESSGWRKPELEAPVISKESSSTKSIRISTLVRTALRGISILRVGVAALAPGSVVIYWITSATFGLFQTWIFNWFRHRRATVAPGVPPAPITESPSPTKPSPSKGHAKKSKRRN